MCFLSKGIRKRSNSVQYARVIGALNRMYNYFGGSFFTNIRVLSNFAHRNFFGKSCKFFYVSLFLSVCCFVRTIRILGKIKNVINEVYRFGYLPPLQKLYSMTFTYFFNVRHFKRYYLLNGASSRNNF